MADEFIPTWKYVQNILQKVFKRQAAEQQVDHDPIMKNNNNNKIFLYAFF